MRRILQPIEHEGMVKVPYDCESNTERGLLFARCESNKIEIHPDPLHPLRVWLVIKPEQRCKLIDHLFILMGFNVK